EDNNNEMEINNTEEQPVDEIADDESDILTDYEKIKANYSELNNRFLRLAADFDNYKKRVSKEKTDLSLNANEEMVRELLNVLDNLNLAIEHASPDGDISSTVEGIKLVYNLFLSTLDRFGLSAIDSSTGTEFDPRLHQAIERIETEEITPGLVLDELIRGYMFKERLLRPASVTVSTDILEKKKSVSTEDNSEIDSDNEKVIEIKKDSINNSDDNVFDLTDEELE
ncbi:MAG: nucleotide exchange factor GrpE, partial [Thermodesulfobacteriota bacterium]